MARELKTLAEISNWLTSCVRQHPECRDARVSVQHQLQAPDESGCNWSRDVIINAGGGDIEDVRTQLAPFFEEARKRFNVPD